MTNETASFITTRSTMLRMLLNGRTVGNTVGIWAPALGQGMFICTVKDVLRDEDENDIVIILSEDELTSPRPNSYVLYLSEIERIYPFITQPVTTLNARY